MDVICPILFNSEEYLAKSEKGRSNKKFKRNNFNMIKNVMPNLIGGSADLAPSNKTNMKGCRRFL